MKNEVIAILGIGALGWIDNVNWLGFMQYVGSGLTILVGISALRFYRRKNKRLDKECKSENS